MRTQRLWPVAAFTALYLAAATAGALALGNREFVFYIVVMVLLVCVIWLVQREIRLSTAALWALSVWGLAHMAGGLVAVPESWPINGDIRVLYSLWLIPQRLKYDQAVHAYGFGMTTWVCWQGLRAAIRHRGGDATPTPLGSPRRGTFGLMVLAATAGMGFGALNEVVEFAATLLVPETNVGGYLNTGWDLVANATGSTVAALVIWVRGSRASVSGPPAAPLRR